MSLLAFFSCFILRAAALRRAAIIYRHMHFRLSAREKTQKNNTYSATNITATLWFAVSCMYVVRFEYFMFFSLFCVCVRACVRVCVLMLAACTSTHNQFCEISRLFWPDINPIILATGREYWDFASDQVLCS